MPTMAFDKSRKAFMWFTLILLVLGGFLLIDILSYFLIPPRYTRFAPEYRLSPVYTPTLGRGYPRYYSRADPLLGFDITPLASGNHIIRDGLNYEVFANDLGCFDKNNREDFSNNTQNYAYFAGDSFTWGYAKYEDKFATVWETKTGILAAKCGVGHTGTRHQFEKFKMVTNQIGRPPSVVIVGFYPNDIANDFTFPHTTVIEGYQVDTVYIIGDKQIVHIPYEDLASEVSRQIKKFEKGKSEDLGVSRNSLGINLKMFVKRHSLLANIGNTIWEKMLRGGIFSKNSTAEYNPSNPKFGRSLYRLFNESAIRTEFAHSSLAEPTKEAIKTWSRDAKSQGYRLIFLLIPPVSDFNRADFFDQVKAFLLDQNVEVIDLALLFKERGWSREELYWQIDDHLNDAGNRLVGIELSRLIH